MKKCILLCGNGGQGLIMAGILLGEAAVIFEGINAIQNQTYGVQARGGESSSEVVISDQEINFAIMPYCDVMIALSQTALNAYAARTRASSVVLVDSELVPDTSRICPEAKVYSFPITRRAVELTGKPMLANVVSLGILSRFLPEISYESIEKAVARRVPPKTIAINCEALRGGYDLLS